MVDSGESEGTTGSSGKAGSLQAGQYLPYINSGSIAVLAVMMITPVRLMRGLMESDGKS